MKHGKKYLEAAKAVDRSIQYDPADAISTVKKLATAKFDETIEVHIKTGCDGRHADQQIRGAVVLPHGTGKQVQRDAETDCGYFRRARGDHSVLTGDAVFLHHDQADLTGSADLPSDTRRTAQQTV